jgi:NADPH-dependent glutamate synthase beta subunit-like oxidoreductase/NAD(P)H-flavin reductase
MILSPKLKLKNCQYADLFHSEGLENLDQQFLMALKKNHLDLWEKLLEYRKNPSHFAPEIASQILIEAAKILERFIAELFQIESAVSAAYFAIKKEEPIFAFKSWYVLKEAKRRLRKNEKLPSFQTLNKWLFQKVKASQDKELAVAKLGLQFLQEPIKYEKEIDLLINWCAQALKDPEGKERVKGWVSFDLPKRLDYEQLVPLTSANELGLQGSSESFRERDGFHLTDSRASARKVQSEAHYCIYCHTHQGDFCSTGFPIKKTDRELGFRKNPLEETLTGCPLDEKVSEMNVLKKEGFTIASLAVVMIDNPLCPATGHRVCNDCMKSCIYQKQSPVDIPQIESAVLVDVLNLPWGVEIYDLLTRWNPLRHEQIFMKPPTGHKIMIAGMGPAGFSLAHHLTLEGCTVIGIDGLKIEPIYPNYLEKPIYRWDDLKESLDERLISGFGGVAEYGITVRWDKNFLKLIYLSLMRRKSYFKVFGNVRFGGTLRVEDTFELGFDHLALALGAGLPQAINIPNSLAPGMRQAVDFLMALQLSGAGKKDNLAAFQIRLPIVVIGGGLTAVDAATEAQAYYIRQVEKILFYYEKLSEKIDRKDIQAQMTALEWEILQEFLTHGQVIRRERKQAIKENRAPQFLALIRKWGGVTIAYRRSIQESPAYRFNHEELKKALEEGIYYQEHLAPLHVKLDQKGQTQALVCINASQEKQSLPAHCILVATGIKPNTAYEFEHRGTFRRSGQFYDAFKFEQDSLKEVTESSRLKDPSIGILTSYQEKGNYVSFLGDMHPAFQGSVVKAMASAKYAYPEILKTLPEKVSTEKPSSFFAKMADLFCSEVIHVNPINPEVFELTVKSTQACKHYRPGEFYRLQTYASYTKSPQQQTEAVAALGTSVDKAKGLITFLLWKEGLSRNCLSLLKPGDPISVMGPTGVRMKIPKDYETILIIGQKLSIPLMFSVGKAMREAGNHVIYMGFQTEKEKPFLKALERVTDQMFWLEEKESILSSLKKHKRVLKNANRVIVNASPAFLKTFKSLQEKDLRSFWSEKTQFIFSVYGMMQCMLKGICAQCLQWQIDPESGARTKAVFSCSWQDQPMELVDIENLEQRLEQNRVQEKLYKMWAEVFK